MLRGLRRLLAILQLMRAALVFTAMADSAAGAILDGRSSWWPVLGVTATSGGLYAAGMILNDIADVKRDGITSPGKVLPSRRVWLGHAWLLAAAQGAMAVMSGERYAEWIGRPACARLVAGALGGILLYNFLTKPLGWLGILTLGTIRLLNASFPVGHVTIHAAVVGGYVTLISAAGYVLEGKRPRLWPLRVGGRPWGKAFMLWGLLGLIALDAGFVVASGRLAAGLGILALLPVSFLCVLGMRGWSKRETG